MSAWLVQNLCCVRFVRLLASRYKTHGISCSCRCTVVVWAHEWNKTHAPVLIDLLQAANLGWSNSACHSLVKMIPCILALLALCQSGQVRLFHWLFFAVLPFSHSSFSYHFHAFFPPSQTPPSFSTESQGRLTFQAGEKGGHMVVKTTASPSPEERKVKQKEWQEGKRKERRVLRLRLHKPECSCFCWRKYYIHYQTVKLQLSQWTHFIWLCVLDCV